MKCRREQRVGRVPSLPAAPHAQPEVPGPVAQHHDLRPGDPEGPTRLPELPEPPAPGVQLLQRQKLLLSALYWVGTSCQKFGFCSSSKVPT